jgi:hypothetical protein
MADGEWRMADGGWKKDPGASLARVLFGYAGSLPIRHSPSAITWRE